MKKITLSNGQTIFVKNVDKIKTAKVQQGKTNQTEFFILLNYIGDNTGTFIGPFQSQEQAENTIINDLN